jgi:riboflavin synthase
MFTGIVRERGRVASMRQEPEGLRLEIDAPATASQLGVGDSVSVSGTCLTATAVSNGGFSVTAVAETLDRTTLGRLSPEDEVNLETATRAGDPLGGHFVQGHVDAVGRIASVDAGRVWVQAEPAILRYCVEKGSITVDGVSLTVASVDDRSFTVSLIPTTLALTTLGRKQVGDPVNLEVDVVAKYVERLLAPGPSAQSPEDPA